MSDSSSDTETKPPVAKKMKIEGSAAAAASTSSNSNGNNNGNIGVEVKGEDPDDEGLNGDMADIKVKTEPKEEPEFDDDDELVFPVKVKKEDMSLSRTCPYLDTIDRALMDFDFEKLCSVSLSRINVYACLVCGKYFQGRGTSTHAYTHSVAENHHVFMNLHTLKFYCLPDNYEVIDSSLDDIKYLLNPTFRKHQIQQLDENPRESRSIDGSMYLPGVVGLNNIKANDYCNVVLQALCHVKPVRDYFLREESYSGIKRPAGDVNFLIVQRFGELMRKIWNPRNFKTHVSPHEMLQAVVSCSKKQFQITEQGDPIMFLSWFLNAMHKSMNGTKKRESSIIYKTFLGSMRVFTKKIESESITTPEEMEETTFLYLTCDLPPTPLFKNELMENIIPQVNLYSLLGKFNGVQEREYKTYKENFLKRYEVTSLPPYLILYIRRFTKNTFFIEKNPTIVNFPISGVDFGEAFNIGSQCYDLIANIVHEGQHKGGTWRLQMYHKSTNTWYELQDLHVKEILPQMLTLTEPYIQIYQKSDLK